MSDTKITGLSALTTATTDDIVPVVDDVAGTPVTRKITKRGLIRDAILTANAGSSYEINWSLATVFELTLTASPTFTFSNMVAGDFVTLYLIQGSPGGHTPSWPAAVLWPGGVPPSLTSATGSIDVITFGVGSDGTTVYGYLGGLDFS